MWNNVWKPETINDIIGNKQSITKIDNWIKNHNNEKSKCLIISGKNGIGKTISTKLLLEHNKYDYNYIYPDDIKHYRANDNIKEFYNYENSITSVLCEKKKKIALVFDNINNISLTNEKKFINEIFKENCKKGIMPIIFISNNSHNKFINDLKKNCLEIKLYPPSSIDLNKFLKKLCKENKIVIQDKDSLYDLIDFSQYDIRSLINIFFDYKFNYNCINENNVKKFIKKSLNKSENCELYDMTLSLLNDFEHTDTIYKYYETDKVLLPLMMHENYYKKILNDKSDNFDECLDDLINVAESMSIADNIETSIYTDQNWYLQHIHGFHTCVYPSYIVNKYDKKLLSKQINFSMDLNKTSSKNINKKKNIEVLKSIVGKKNINDILYICRFSNNMYNKKYIQQFIDIIKKYKPDINIKDFEIFLKIDKTIEFKTLTLKEKKGIISFL